MIAFANQFISYLIVMIASMAIVVLAVFCGKKLRDRKDAKSLSNIAAEETDETNAQ